MKRSLVSIIVFLLLDLSASTYKWSASADKETAYINEAILLTYVCEFSDASELYTIDFNPVQDNEHFSIKLLKERQVLKDLKRVNTYEYIAYVKKEGSISFDFDIVMKKTTQESINSVIRGHYDDSKSESFVSTPIKQLPLMVNIKDTFSKLVGEFILNVEQDMPKITAYQPYHLEMQIQGVGNFTNLDSVHFAIDGVKVFTEGAVLKTKLTQDGEKGVWSQKFAFVSEKSFKIPEFSINYFNLKTSTLERLTFDAINVNVTKPIHKEEELLKTKEKKDFVYKPEYLYYLLIFFLGFFLAKIKFKIPRVQKTEEERFLKSIKRANSLEALCFLLVTKDAKKYKELISKIESRELTSLRKAKKIVLKTFRD